jgi:hypothetical protein
LERKRRTSAVATNETAVSRRSGEGSRSDSSEEETLGEHREKCQRAAEGGRGAEKVEERSEEEKEEQSHAHSFRG